VGKSTVAHALASQLSATLVSQDALLGQVPSNTTDRKHRACLLAAALATSALESGIPVVLDVGFYWSTDSEWLRRVRSATDEVGGVAIRIRLTAPLDVLLTRNRRRGRRMSDQEVRQHFEQYQALDDDADEACLPTENQRPQDTTEAVVSLVASATSRDVP
jgi:predicted kinase